ncbi:Nn.00g062540.m01.CDS01 [Neocucurbitaria sp. VM-36]
MPSAYTVIKPAPEPETPKGHIGDLDTEVLYQILFRTNHQDLPAIVVSFALASPHLMHRVDYYRILDMLNFDPDGGEAQRERLWWWKKRALNRAQGKLGKTATTVEMGL